MKSKRNVINKITTLILAFMILSIIPQYIFYSEPEITSEIEIHSFISPVQNEI